MSPPVLSTIKVHVLNFHSIFSHIEIVLENTSAQPHTYYGINRWATPENRWYINGPKELIEQASSVYSFDIEANTGDITNSWNKYWYETENEASIIGKNCAVAAQWFLTKYAGIPEPDLSNVSLNHFIFGIMLPSYVPFPITLPGRVMSNAQFHIEARNNPEIANKYSHLLLCTAMAVTALTIGASIIALVVAATVLSGGIAGAVITGCVAAGALSSYGFFKAYNTLSAQHIAADMKKKEEPSFPQGLSSPAV